MSTPALPFDPIEEAARSWREHGWVRGARQQAHPASVTNTAARLEATGL